MSTKKDVTIDFIRSQKEHIEHLITQMLNDFREQTGVSVCDIHLTTAEAIKGGKLIIRTDLDLEIN